MIIKAMIRHSEKHNKKAAFLDKWDFAFGFKERRTTGNRELRPNLWLLLFIDYFSTTRWEHMFVKKGFCKIQRKMTARLFESVCSKPILVLKNWSNSFYLENSMLGANNF